MKHMKITGKGIFSIIISLGIVLSFTIILSVTVITLPAMAVETASYTSLKNIIMRKVISNTTPLIALANIGYIQFNQSINKI